MELLLFSYAVTPEASRRHRVVRKNEESFWEYNLLLQNLVSDTGNTVWNHRWLRNIKGNISDFVIITPPVDDIALILHLRIWKSQKVEVDTYNLLNSSRLVRWHVSWWPLLGILSWYPVTLVKSLQLIWRLGTCRLNLQVPNLQMSWSDVTES